MTVTGQWLAINLKMTWATVISDPSGTTLVYKTEKWLSSDRRFTDSWLWKWVIIKSSSDAIIEKNDLSFFSHSSVISDPSG